MPQDTTEVTIEELPTGSRESNGTSRDDQAVLSWWERSFSDSYPTGPISVVAGPQILPCRQGLNQPLGSTPRR
jgi:hypothetical protein